MEWSGAGFCELLLELASELKTDMWCSFKWNLIFVVLPLYFITFFITQFAVFRVSLFLFLNNFAIL